MFKDSNKSEADYGFGKLQEDLFTKNVESFTVDRLARLFGALYFVFQSAANSAVTT